MKINPALWPWIITFIFIVLVVYYISGILLPFISGLFLAYALNPVVTHLERYKIPRGGGTFIMLATFFIILALLLLILIPFLKDELTVIAASIPEYGQKFVDITLPYLEEFNKYTGSDLSDLREKASAYIGDMFSWSFRIIANLLTNTLALANLISLIIITPIVSFYLLRDWPIMLDQITRLLPRRQAPLIIELGKKVNKNLGGYLRGQTLVCVIQAITFAIGLSLVGLNYAVTIGIVTGLLAFIPYVGILIGVAAGMGVAFSQFNTWLPIFLVAAVFLAGNILESQFLSPKIVGKRIGLHPVWVIFALLAGGSLFGFIGMIFALPVAAIISVVVRYFIALYVESDLYHGNRVPVPIKSKSNEE